MYYVFYFYACTQVLSHPIIRDSTVLTAQPVAPVAAVAVAAHPVMAPAQNRKEEEAREDARREKQKSILSF